MAIRAFFNRTRATTPAKARKTTSRLGVETLEERLALSTVSIANRVLTYQAAPGEVNSLQISRSGNTFTFAETGGVAIQLGNTLNSSVTANSSLFDRIEVKLGDQSDSLTVLSTNKRIDAFGEAGNDTVTAGAAGAGLDGITALVKVNGGAQDAAGKDQLFLADRDAAAIASTKLTTIVNGASVTRQRRNLNEAVLSSHQVTSTNMESLAFNASNQADTIIVNSVTAATPVEINAGNGADKINVGSSMDVLAGKLTVRGEIGDDVLTVTDTAAQTARNYVLTGSSLTQGAATIDYTTLEDMTIQAPNRVNNLSLQNLGNGLKVKYQGGTLQDTITFDNTASNTASTYFFDAGKARQGGAVEVTYTSVQRVIVNGGNASDSFRVNAITAGTPLTLNGGGGGNNLDFADFASFAGVEANLVLGKVVSKVLVGTTATSITSLISNIKNITGSEKADILVGDANQNVIQGKGGRDVVIGGRGQDLVNGGAGEDLVIASDTNFDANEAALRAIQTLWNSTNFDYLTRIDRLKTGNGVAAGVKLDETTVHVGAANDDATEDRIESQNDLFGGAANDRDWFWARLNSGSGSDVIFGRETSGQFIELVN